MERILHNFIKSCKEILWGGSNCFLLGPFSKTLENKYGLRYSRVAGMRKGSLTGEIGGAGVKNLFSFFDI